MLIELVTDLQNTIYNTPINYFHIKMRASFENTI